MRYLKYVLLIVITSIIAACATLAIFPTTAQINRSLSIQGELVCVTMTPVPSSTPTSVPTSTPVADAAINGIVFTGPTSVDNGNDYIERLNADWWYNYNPILWGGTTTGVPMLHTRSTAYGLGIAPSYVPKGSYYLVYNEPDRNDQDNLSPTVGAQEYKRLREGILATDPTAKFIVGGVSDLDAGGQAWLKSMASEYKRLYSVTMPADGYHAHLYLCGRDYSSWTYRKKIEMFHNWLIMNGLGGEFWLTETGCLSNHATAETILKENKAWLNTAIYTERWAWFATQNPYGSGSLLDGNGALTTLGNLYK